MGEEVGDIKENQIRDMKGIVKKKRKEKAAGLVQNSEQWVGEGADFSGYPLVDTVVNTPNTHAFGLSLELFSC